MIGVLCVPAGALAEEAHKSEIVWVEKDQVAEGGNPNVSKIIYVNGCFDGGCQIEAGNFNDARDNTSTIPNRDSTLSPFMHDQATWDATLQCLREVYGPYDVQIVEEDPGELFHHEAILAGHPTEMGLSSDIGGIAPSNCEPLNNVISFSFSNLFGPDPIELCWTVAQESAHAYGLDHVFECLDPLTYLPGCGQKFFRNKLLPCGEFSERPCRCSGMFQNSHQTLDVVFGAGTPPPPPMISIDFPAEGEVVGDGFPIFAAASDARLVDKIELYVNGWLYETVPGHSFAERASPYSLNAPDLPDSVMDVELRAYNDLGSNASATIRVTKGAPCTSADACLAGQECDGEGRCIYPPPTGELGDSCERAMDCVSLLCPSNGDDKVCSEFCSPNIGGQCPDGFDCLAAGDSGVCWPASGEDTGGCCSVGSERGPSSGHIALTLFVLGALFVRRRRRQ